MEGESLPIRWTPCFCKDKNGEVVADKVAFSKKDGSLELVEVVGGEVVVPAGAVMMDYFYDNEVVPACDVPSVHSKTAYITLMAKARRIGIEFTQTELFQASTDYEYDLAKEMAETAIAELQREINEEVILFLADMGEKNVCAKAEFNLTLPVGVSRRDHYESFIDSIITAKNYIWNATQRYNASVLLCSSQTLRVLNFIPNFKAAATSDAVGSYIAGTLDGMKVIVSPSIEEGKNFLIVKGNDLKSAAAVYGAYMPIMPTQLVETWDGHNRQGFATMYALAALNDKLVCEFDIVEKERVVATRVAD